MNFNDALNSFVRFQELCHYQGTIRGLPGSWVAVSTCRGLRGTIFDGKETHYVQPESNSLDSQHYIYRGSHLTTNKTCGKKNFIFYLPKFIYKIVSRIRILEE